MAATDYHLAELLKGLGAGRLLLDLRKRQLVDLPGFNQVTVFNLLDSDRKGQITLANLYEFLRSRHVQPSEIELFHLFKHIDRLKLGYIDSAQLFDFLVPQVRHGTLIGKSSCEDLSGAVTAIFEQVLQNIRQFEQRRIQLRLDGDIKGVFCKLDSNKNGRVSTLEIRSWMLAHGCHDQDVVASAIVELQSRLGNHFTEEDFSIFLVGEENWQEERQEWRNPQVETVTTTTTAEFPELYDWQVRKQTIGGLQDFDKMMELRNQQNEQRRRYLRQQERLREKLMDDVLNRKKNYANLRMDGASLQKVQKRLETEEDMQCKIYDKEVELHRVNSAIRFKDYSEKLSMPPSPINDSGRLLRGYQSRDELVKKATAEAQHKIQQIELTAKAKAEERRRLDQLPRDPTPGGYQELLIRKNSELEMERQRRLSLQKQLSKSREQIKILRNHLQSIEKLNYVESQLGRGRENEPSLHVKKPKIHQSMSRPYERLTEVLKDTISRGDSPSFTKESDSKYLLQQALRRSRVERQFAKYKLEKELARSRIPWR